MKIRCCSVVATMMVVLCAALGWTAYRYRTQAKALSTAMWELSKARSAADADELNRDARAAAVGATVFIGDSLAGGWRTAAAFPGAATINRGLGGYTTTEMLNRIKSDVIDLKARTVVIMAGTNDLLLNNPDCDIAAEKVAKNLFEAVQISARDGARVFLASVPP